MIVLYIGIGLIVITAVVLIGRWHFNNMREAGNSSALNEEEQKFIDDYLQEMQIRESLNTNK